MSEKKKTTYSLGIVLLALAIGLAAGFMTAPKVKPQDVPNVTGISKLGSHLVALEYIIANYYVDEVDYDSLTTSAMTAMLESLDPHSSYLTPIANSKENEMMQSRFEGIGVTLHSMNDSVFASTVRAGSPAHRAGIRAGDRIIKVDTTVVTGTGMSEELSSVVNLIRGPRYSTVTLGIQRQGSDKIREIKVKRDVILHPTVVAAVMIDKHTGYVNISRFSETTASEFHAALLQLTKEGMTHLVLDLRGNRGGSLETAIAVADELLPKGDLIVYTEGAHSPRNNHYATRGGLFEEGKLTILINEFSASASEVVSGAIQDNDRGTIIGRRSFGKGLVQQPISLHDGSMIRLTIARYYSPSGRCIQKPYTSGADRSYEEDLMNRYQHGEFFNGDSIKHDGPEYHTHNGRVVYGGGGITPDIFVGEDTLGVTSYYREASMSGLILQFAYEYVDENRQQLSNYTTKKELLAYLKKLNTVELFAQYAEKNGLKRRNLMIQKSHALLERYINSRLIYNVLDEQAWTEYLNDDDPAIRETLRVFKNGESFPKPGDDEKKQRKVAYDYSSTHRTLKLMA